MKKILIASILLFNICYGQTSVQPYQQWYQYLHAHPELSGQENNTAAYLKEQMKDWGYTLIDSLGMHSFAAVLKNGNGPVILYRTDLDGLPVKEQTGLPYASTATGIKNGEQVSVMHACGHDIHMSAWLGIAKKMSETRKQWSGTLVLLAQSAEELGQGAKRVIASANYKTLPTANYQLAIHDHASLPAGKIGFCDGFSMAAVDMMNITIYGKGGHGAVPDQTIDPVVLASQYVLAVQTIVSRNLSPNDPAVITIGAIHGGAAGNVIPDQVELRLTIRSYSDAARQTILDRLQTIGNNLAAAAGLTKERFPKFDLLDMSIPSVYNTPTLGDQLRTILRNKAGENSYTNVLPVMIGEDFGIYGRQPNNIPSYILWMGTASDANVMIESKAKGMLPTLHSAKFAPDAAKTLPGAVEQMTTLLYGLFEPSKKK